MIPPLTLKLNEDKPDLSPPIAPVATKVEGIAANAIIDSEGPSSVLGFTDELMPIYLKKLIKVCRSDGLIESYLKKIKARIQYLLTLEIMEKERISLRQFDAIIRDAQDFLNRSEGPEDRIGMLMGDLNLMNIKGWLESIEGLQSIFHKTVSLTTQETATGLISPYKKVVKELNLYLIREDARLKKGLKKWLDKVMTRIEGFLKKEYYGFSNGFTRTIMLIRQKERYNIRTSIEEAIAYTKKEVKTSSSQIYEGYLFLPHCLEDLKFIIRFFLSREEIASLMAISAEWMRCVALRQNIYNQEYIELPFTEDMKHISAIPVIAAEWLPLAIENLIQIAHREYSARYWMKKAQFGIFRCNEDWLQAHSAARRGLALCTQPPIGEPLVIYSYLQNTLRMIQEEAAKRYDAQVYLNMVTDCNFMEGEGYEKLKKVINKAVENIGMVRDAMLSFSDQSISSVRSLRILASREIFLKTNGYFPWQLLDRMRLYCALAICEAHYRDKLEPYIHLKFPELKRPRPFEDVYQEDIEACLVKFNPLLQRKIKQYDEERLLLGPADGVSLNQFPVFKHMRNGILSINANARAIRTLPSTQEDLNRMRDTASNFSSNNHVLMIQFLDRPFFDEISKTTLMQCWKMVAETNKQQLEQIERLLSPDALEQIQSA